MKGYLTNSKVVCSPELKMTKVGPLSTSSSIWTELGSEKSFLKEHTQHGRIEHSVEITLKTGSKIQSDCSLKCTVRCREEAGLRGEAVSDI